MDDRGNIISGEAIEELRARLKGTRTPERAEADMRRWTELTPGEAAKLRDMNRHDRRAELSRMRKKMPVVPPRQPTEEST